MKQIFQTFIKNLTLPETSKLAWYYQLIILAIDALIIYGVLILIRK
ncbi:MAG: hypothetical protein ACP5J8_02395 [Minisyncoccia bacterium]